MTETLDDVLAHYGVKGMKWGVRKVETSRQKSFREAAKADKKWEKNVSKTKHFPKLYNKGADHMNTVGINKINNKPEFKNVNFDKIGWDSPKGRKYMKAMTDEFDEAMSKAAQEQFGTSATGKRAMFKTDERTGMPGLYIVENAVKHAEVVIDGFVVTDEIEVRFSKGQISGLGSVTPIEHSNDDGDILVHYGVKGMKWGVRKSRSDKIAARSAPSKVTERVKPSRRGAQTIRVTNRSGGRVKTTGGKRNIATKDAVNVAVSRQKAKKSSTNALSNAELKQVVDRMNLENQFYKLTKEQAKQDRGRKFIEALFKGEEGSLVGAAAAAASTTTARQVRPRAITTGPRVIDM